ncbi:hypothetical protein HYS84_00180 [Candidatus Saccharibacteria bacterium]|nr:hypothetical protein [Candidatus Saccharibacteria bacterium]
MAKPEPIPIDQNCPLLGVDIEDHDKIALRDRAAQLVYDSWPPVEWSEVSGIIQSEFDVTPEIADLTVECIGKISRKYCYNCDLGSTPSGEFTLVHRQ